MHTAKFTETVLYSYEQEVVSQYAQSHVQLEDDSEQAPATNRRHSLTTDLGLHLSALIIHNTQRTNLSPPLEGVFSCSELKWHAVSLTD